MKRNELLIPISELNYSNYFHFLTSAMRHLQKVIVQLQEKKEAALSTLSTPEENSTNMSKSLSSRDSWTMDALCNIMEPLWKNAQPPFGHGTADFDRKAPRQAWILSIIQPIGGSVWKNSGTIFS